MRPQISILGTGWLGMPLATHFVHKNYVVKGSTTSDHKLEILEKNRIIPYKIGLTEQGPVGDTISFLEQSDVLIINIPPGLRKNPKIDFVSKISTLIPYIQKSTIKNVLFVSSTSVFSESYPFPLISEETKPNAVSNAGKQLIEVEQRLQNNTSFATTILRFAGLFNNDRHPAHMLSKRKSIKNPKAPVNLIHLNDCIGIIQKIIETNSWNTFFNAAYPDHPKKFKYYSRLPS